MKSTVVRSLLLVLALSMLAGCSLIERKLLFHPTHKPHLNSLTPWVKQGQVIGYAREVKAPQNAWLMLHGNAGQASDRLYAVPSFAPGDSVYILEYPGYGDRPGSPSMAAFDRAAREAYEFLRETHPHRPVCVAAESIGSGPACRLAGLAPPPDKLVLIVTFDRLALVAEDHFPAFLVRLVLTADWDNVRALTPYPGPVEIIGAKSDTVIPVRHAIALAAAVPNSKLSIIAGGHNDWSYGNRVIIRNP